MKKLRECLSQVSTNCVKSFKTDEYTRFCPACKNTIAHAEISRLKSNHLSDKVNDDELDTFWLKLK